MDKRLHIISFEVPWPANYGGVIDVFYKIKSLHAIGVKIILHCFTYHERTAQDELNKYCEQVFYYQRTTGLEGVSMLRPYIVNSRKSASLLKNLREDNAPILFEGLHTCYFLNHPELAKRKKIVRAHNIEHEYYSQLAAKESTWFKRLYYKYEAYMLKHYEAILKDADYILAISEDDQKYFQQKFTNSVLVSAFHENESISIKEGKGDFCLFHGNLAINENEQAAIFLIDKVFDKLPYKLIIAGANPSKTLVERIAEARNTSLVQNPSMEEMNNLMHDAHIHVFYSEGSCGLKLKLINALFQGRFVVANHVMIPDKCLRDVITTADTPSEYIEAIERLMNSECTLEYLEKRRLTLSQNYMNQQQAAVINNLIS